VANKIGTYTLAVLARQHGIPFFVAAPRSTIDLETPSGDAIPIEERGRDEIATLAGVALLPDGVPVRHPAFDVTPAEFVTGIVTERGIALPPFGKSLARLVQEM
jgi:methylthioribose-1-phosphate isomerase